MSGQATGQRAYIGARMVGIPLVPVNWISVFVAAGVTIYFWWQNIKGIEESSDKAMKIMYVTTVMVVIILGWSLFTLLTRPNIHRPPWPIPENLHFAPEALGFWRNSDIPKMFALLGFSNLVRLEDYVKDMQAISHDYVLMGVDLKVDEDYAGVGG